MVTVCTICCDVKNFFA